MLFAIKNEINECFIGVFQFLYYQKFGQYLPSIIIKDIFYFTRNGVNFKTITQQFKPFGTCDFYWTKYHEVALEKWFIIAQRKNNLWHFMVLKKMVNSNIIFDPQKGFIKNQAFNDQFVILNINFSKKINFKKEITWPLAFDKMIIFNCLIATFLTIFLSFYLKIAMEAIALRDHNYLINIIIVFTSFGLGAILWRFWTTFYLQRFIWTRVKNLYLKIYQTFYNKNNKVKIFFTYGQVQEAINCGIEYYVYLIETHQQIFVNLILVISTMIIIVLHYGYFLGLFLFFIFCAVIIMKKHQQTYYLAKRKIINNQVAINNHNVDTWTNLELAQGFLQEQYWTKIKMLKTKYYNHNVAFNKKTNHVSFSFDFLLFLLNFFNSIIIFFLIYNQQMTIIVAIFLITMGNMFYSNMMQIIVFFNNHKHHRHKLYKFNDLFTTRLKPYSQFSYNGQKFFSFSLPQNNGFYQIFGANGAGKTTILKKYCHLFSSPHYQKIYLGKNHTIYNKVKPCDLAKYPFALNLNKPFYSAGEQQIINLINCLEKPFKVLILDEGLTSVTREKRILIYEWLNQKYKNKIIFIVDHQIKIKKSTTNIVI